MPEAHRGTARRPVGVPPDGLFCEGKCSGTSKKIEINPKTGFLAPESCFSAPESHPNLVENPTSPWDPPRSAPNPPRVLPGQPRTSRSAKKIREPVGDQFFGARIEFSGSETLQNPSETTRKPSLTVGRAGEAPRAPLGASPTPPATLSRLDKNQGFGAHSPADTKS